MLRFTGGTRGALVVSQVSPGRKNRLALQLDTSEAAFAWNQEHPDTAWVGRRRAANLEYLRDPSQGQVRQLPAGHPEGWRDALCHLCADFYGAVDASRNGRDHESRFATFADGHRMALLVEAIMQSDRTGSWIEVGELDRVR
jgi:predicted dehydrogenase